MAMPRIPDTTADDRLTGLESFLEFWLGPRRPEYGVPTDKLAEIELPLPLRRSYTFARRWPPARLPYYENRFPTQDSFLPLKSMYRSGPRLVFLTENQGVWHVSTLAGEGDDPDVLGKRRLLPSNIQSDMAVAWMHTLSIPGYICFARIDVWIQVWSLSRKCAFRLSKCRM
jgi:hypothetical protein